MLARQDARQGAAGQGPMRCQTPATGRTRLRPPSWRGTKSPAAA
ncbi:hypothetical protein RGUI_2390 [Rhodovulum sp. P5]|nr:hypothetical protein RGUI_2390 [Rhodovulum sp. P5]